MRLKLFVALFSGLLFACAGRTTGIPLTLPESTTKALFYVEHQPEDGRHLESVIVEVLVERGFLALTAKFQRIPADADFLVTYVDRWQWDMRMYLLDLRIEVRDPVSRQLIAYGQSYQSSLKAMGWSHKDVIELAISQLLGRDGLR